MVVYPLIQLVVPLTALHILLLHIRDIGKMYIDILSCASVRVRISKGGEVMHLHKSS